MASVLKEHAVGTTDKITLGKVEEMLNTVLKELQREKTRSQQLQEQMRKLAAERHFGKPVVEDLEVRLRGFAQQIKKHEN